MILIFFVLAQGWDYFNRGTDWVGSCKTLPSQSPINIKTFTEEINSSYLAYTYLQPSYRDATVSKSFSDNTYKVIGTFGTLTANERSLNFEDFAAYEINIHAPAEHMVNDVEYDLELQIYHRSSLDTTVVLSVLFNLGNDTQSLDEISDLSSASINIASLFPTGFILNYYQYKGSLTVPDCDIGVEWIIVTGHTIGENQLSFFADQWANNASFAGGYGNNRPIQDKTYDYIVKYTAEATFIAFSLAIFPIMIFNIF